MQTYPIDHIAALELFTCRDSFAGLGALGDDLSDAAAKLRDFEARYVAALDAAQGTALYKAWGSLWSELAKQDKALNDELAAWQANPSDLATDAHAHAVFFESGGAFWQADSQLNAIEMSVQQESAKMKAVGIVGPPAPSAYTYKSPAFVGPPAPDNYTRIVQANPTTLGVAQSGTTPVDPNSSLATSLADVLSAGAGIYTQQQIQSVVAQAQAANKPIYAPQSLVNQARAKVPPKSSLASWLIAGGIGALFLGGITWYAVKRR